MPPVGHAVPLEQTLWGDPAPHAALLHGGAQGQIAICRGRGGWLQDFVGAARLVAAVAAAAGEADTFVSQNTFAGPSRRVDTVRQLRSLFVDLDCYRCSLQPAAALQEIEARAQAGRIPWPSAALWSGRGLAAIWLLRPAPAQALPRWVAVEQALYLRSPLKPITESGHADHLGEHNGSRAAQHRDR